MKKTIAILLTAAMLCLSAACGQVGPDSAVTEPEATPTPDATPIPEGQEVHEYTFTFTRENFPRMDGSTATVPLAQAVASVLLGESREDVADLAVFNRTTQSYYNLSDGLCDILIAAEPSEEARAEIDAEGFQLMMEPLAMDALIFVVNENNPVDSLTAEQIRGIYTGEISNWSQVGGLDQEIQPFQRNEGAGSQTLMLKLVMGDTPMMTAPTELVAGAMGELMEVVKSYDNSASAIGYSVYYYANDMQMADGLKIIAVDGVQPNAETIGSGEYPYLNPYYVVIDGTAAEDSPARILFNWLLSEEGQALVESEGYVAVQSAAESAYKVQTDYSNYAPIEEETAGAVYTRLSEDWIDGLEAGDDYGALYPFTGVTLGSGYSGGALYGFADETGRIVCDPVYTAVERLGYYDMVQNRMVYTPLLQLSHTVDSQMRYTLCSADGRFVSEGSYGYVEALSFGFVCADSFEADDFVIYDFEGNVLMSREDMDIGDLRMDYISYISDGGDGLLLVELTGGSGGNHYYMNTDGQILLGPYRYAYAFNDGRAVVSVAQKYGCGVIDSYGSWIIDPTWASIGKGHDGAFIARSNSGCTVFDSDGNAIFSTGGDTLNKCMAGYYGGGVYYRPDGSVIEYIDSSWSNTMGGAYTAGCPVLHRYNEDTNITEIMDSRTGKVIEIAGKLYVDQLYINFVVGTYSDIEFVYAFDEMDIAAPPYLISWDTEEVILLENSGSTGMGGARAAEDELTGQCCIVINDSNYAGSLYSADMEMLLDSTAGLRIWNGKFIITDDECCTISDAEGNVLLRYMFVSLGED